MRFSAVTVVSLVAMITALKSLICKNKIQKSFTIIIIIFFILKRFLNKKGLDDSNIDASSFDMIESLKDV